MPTTKELQEQLAWEIKRLISESTDPQSVMEEIATVAERRGLIDSAATPRRETPLAFVKDLWLENPVIHDLLNLQRERLRDPRKMEDLADVLNVLP